MNNQTKNQFEFANLAEKMASNASSPMLNEASKLIDPATLIEKKIDLTAYQIEKKILPNFPDLVEIQQHVNSQGNAENKSRVETIFGNGNTLHQRLRAIPLLGYALAWCNALIKLPVTRNHYLLEIHSLRLETQALHHQHDLLLHNIQILNGKIIHLQNENIQIIEENNAGYRRVAQQLESVMQRVVIIEEAKLIRRMHEMEMHDTGSRLMKLEQLEMPRKLKQFAQLMKIFQTEAIKNQHQTTSTPSTPETPETQTITNTDLIKNTFDQHQFYLDFEEQFRGNRQDIKERLQVYLPYLSDIKSIKEDQRPMMVDVGCGRGEWLSIMMENGFPAIGIDLNLSMVNACLESGYAAKVADALAFLQNQEEGSLGGITGFHIIEHLPFEQLIALFDAAYQSLKKGGIIIFETPNPENLIVGACNFYYDPTHLHPIVPMVAEFIAKQRGFEQVEILRLHPYPENHRMSGDSDADKILNRYLFDAQDYALIARK